MIVQVRFFASLAEQTGSRCESVEVEPAMDVAELWARLVHRHPALGRLSYRPLVACDLTYAGWDQKLEDVREVAFLPPVSGG